MSSERAKKILSAVVRDYINTAEPVSSKAIALKYPMGLSPATIRNAMAELEADGFLIQPHTSAGRIPTDRGFRFYLDGLLELEEPPKDDKDLIKRSCEKPLNIENVLAETAKALSGLTNCAGLMLVPKKDSFLIRHIKFLQIDRNSLTVLLVSNLGMVRTRFIRMGADVNKLDLENISNYLNIIGEGLTVGELRGRIVEEMKKEKNLYDELLAKALKLGAMAFEQEGAEQDLLYVEGKANILDQPEFRDDFEKMKRLFAAFEEKSLLVKILDQSIGESGIHIYLGSECLNREFEGLSFVTAPCGKGYGILGTLGVIGPVRMNYSKIIPLVDYTAGLLSKVF